MLQGRIDRKPDRGGTNAVALIGKSLSRFQQEILATWFKSRPLVLLLDSDAKQEALRIQRQLTDARARAQAGSPSHK